MQILCLSPDTQSVSDPIELAVAYKRTPSHNSSLTAPSLAPSAEALPKTGYYTYAVNNTMIAAIPVQGLLTTRNLGIISSGLRAAAENDKVDVMLMNLSSPGGILAQSQQLADDIAAVKKPVHTYIEHAGGAAYWIAAATDNVMINRTGMAGGLGVVHRVSPEGEDIKTVISSASPYKRPNPRNPDHRSALQENVDDLAEELVTSIASFRSVSTEKVKTQFGKGGFLVGKKAVKVGMADELGHYRNALQKATDAGPDPAVKSNVPVPQKSYQELIHKAQPQTENANHEDAVNAMISGFNRRKG